MFQFAARHEVVLDAWVTVAPVGVLEDEPRLPRRQVRRRFGEAIERTDGERLRDEVLTADRREPLVFVQRCALVLRDEIGKSEPSSRGSP